MKISYSRIVIKIVGFHPTPGSDLIVGVVSRTAMKRPPGCDYPSRFEKALLQGSAA
ncbi:MAG: hypothetical protein ABW185_23990 [Sedimenticola sp.]